MVRRVKHETHDPPYALETTVIRETALDVNGLNRTCCSHVMCCQLDPFIPPWSGRNLDMSMCKLHTYRKPVVLCKDCGDNIAWSLGNKHGLSKPILHGEDQVLILDVPGDNCYWCVDCLSSSRQHCQVMGNLIIRNKCLLTVQQRKSGGQVMLQDLWGNRDGLMRSSTAIFCHFLEENLLKWLRGGS